jgi:hypothetical protein
LLFAEEHRGTVFAILDEPRAVLSVALTLMMLAFASTVARTLSFNVSGVSPGSRRAARASKSRLVTSTWIVASRRWTEAASVGASGSDVVLKTSREVARYVFGRLYETRKTISVSGMTISAMSPQLRRSASP